MKNALMQMTDGKGGEDKTDQTRWGSNQNQRVFNVDSLCCQESRIAFRT